MDLVRVEWSLRDSGTADAPWMAELRAVVMRPDLERLGRYDPEGVRRRFLDAFAAAHTRVIVVEGADIGLIAVRPESDALWIEHFYLAPEWQGRGLGSDVFAHVLGRLRDGGGETRPLRLNVLQGSPARRLYEKHGFVLESEDAVDVFMMAWSDGGA